MDAISRLALYVCPRLVNRLAINEGVGFDIYGERAGGDELSPPSTVRFIRPRSRQISKVPNPNLLFPCRFLHDLRIVVHCPRLPVLVCLFPLASVGVHSAVQKAEGEEKKKLFALETSNLLFHAIFIHIYFVQIRYSVTSLSIRFLEIFIFVEM